MRHYLYNVTYTRGTDPFEPVTLAADTIEDQIAETQGGQLLRPGAYAGTIAIINQQSKLTETDLNAVVSIFAKVTGRRVAVGASGEGKKIALTIVDKPTDPIMLLAPEDQWGIVNMAHLVDDLPSARAKEKFFASRARKMIIKALSLLCGGGGSSFKGNIMNAATVRDLDLAPEQVPVDMQDKYDAYLKKIGITKMEMASYLEACQEGWAPAPTNDVQKRIWKELYTPPSNPIKIKFDPTKKAAK